MVQLGERSYQLPSEVLLAGEYFALYGSNLKFALADSGKDLSLQDLDGEEVDQVSYGKAIKGQSFSKIGEDWFWSTTPTKSAVNILSLPKVSSSKATSTKTASSSNTAKSTTSAKSTATTLTPKSLPANSVASAQSTQTKSSVQTGENNNSDLTNRSNNPAAGLALAAASLGAGAFAIYKFNIFG